MIKSFSFMMISWMLQRALEAPTWTAAVQQFGAGLVYNATSLKPNQKRKVDLGGVSPAAIKGANMAVGGGLNFLPAFILKFQVCACVRVCVFLLVSMDTYV
jgi:hypothetical protein